MKRIRLSIAGAFLLLVSGSLAAQTSVWWMRGEGWRTFEKPEKSLYVQGVLDGLIFADSKVQGVKISYDTSLEHLVIALDQFYSDYRNELVPVPFALKVISQELSGISQSVIDQEITSLRQQFKALQKK